MFQNIYKLWYRHRLSATAGTGFLPSTITLIGWRAVALLSSNQGTNSTYYRKVKTYGRLIDPQFLYYIIKGKNYESFC